jgi:oxepin-CoA hydrolase / 3-oxo-5,6-dehydrosuberyl-CoA semialdehyde dehydrogenase
MRQLSRQPLGTVCCKRNNFDMITIPFDVNDIAIRTNFFDLVLIDCIADLPEEAKPLWGKMSAHNMVEHLIWAFECTNGTIYVPCRTPENLLERVKRFLYDNRPTPQDFKNPLLGDTPLPYRYSTYSEAKEVLLTSIKAFKKYYIEHPVAIHIHPVFGPLRAEEWHRSQYKHCYHHFLQFGILKQAEIKANGA